MIKRPKLSGTGKERKTNASGLTRGAKFRVKNARGRKISSVRWLQRQLNDPYVDAARLDGYRARSAYKLLELDEKFSFLKKSRVIVDLGAAPGSWAQVALKLCGRKARVVGIDLLEVAPLEGATFLEMDFATDEAEAALLDLCQGPVDLVMSDMAAATTGHQQTDHIRTLALVELAFDFARKTLGEGGVFVTKVFRGGADQAMLAEIRKCFASVRHFKPPASRSGSAETYLVAKGFKVSSRHLEKESD
ncbi:23S rRNA (uridine(2552)-2'-O)-methyltransferase [hydrothermal vent metagenome]|uniref:23S rRNA (Uridine(2552)-2'-O)-methyltransferase n=1 Tax=hydrothermal vent metagenome TaxID=652676 RepID=A0A3B1BVC6_9ZZZZ